MLFLFGLGFFNRWLFFWSRNWFDWRLNDSLLLHFLFLLLLGLDLSDSLLLWWWCALLGLFFDWLYNDLLLLLRHFLWFSWWWNRSLGDIYHLFCHRRFRFFGGFSLLLHLLLCHLLSLISFLLGQLVRLFLGFSILFSFLLVSELLLLVLPRLLLSSFLILFRLALICNSLLFFLFGL